MTANAKLKLTTEQADRLRALDEKYTQELDQIREQLYSKGQALKAEWLQTEPDRGKIEILQGKAVKLQGQMRATLAAQRAGVIRVLTPQQRMHIPDDGHGRVLTRPAGFGRR